MSNTVLEMKHITKEFPGVRALDDVSMTAAEGEILAIMGENGAGKSTLMKVLSGSYDAGSYNGEIRIDGKVAEFKSPSDSENAGISMIYQEISVHLDLTVAENMFLNHWPRNKIGTVLFAKLYADAEQALMRVKLDINPKMKMRGLNTSQMQLVTIARALTKKLKILVLDEPTSALTESESQRLFEILHELKAQGITILLISHKMDEVLEHADRITVMRDGKVISTRYIQSVQKDDIIKDMVGRCFESFYPDRDYLPTDEVTFSIKNFKVPHPFSDSRYIVDDVSLDLKRGEILGLAGLVGAGRSELMAAVFGKAHRSSGEVYLDGKKISIQSPHDAIENGLAMVTEDRKSDGFVGKRCIVDNICLASLDKMRKGLGISRKKEKESSWELFDKMDIRAPSMSVLLDTLSGGNQQKVVLSKCLMTEPKILILDEPTKGIDIAAKNKIYNVMVELVQSGVSIIMISSEMPELISMSDRVVVLSYGKKSGELSGAEITQESILKLAMKYS